MLRFFYRNPEIFPPKFGLKVYIFIYLAWQVYFCLNYIDSGRLLPSQMPNPHATQSSVYVVYYVLTLCWAPKHSWFSGYIVKLKEKSFVHLKWVFSCLIYFSHPFWAFLGFFVKSEVWCKKMSKKLGNFMVETSQKYSVFI